jgi:predicted RNA-binding Zn ribbon-like protein
MASRFFWRGNDLGLDLLNTQAVDERGQPLDLMADVDALLEWAGEAGVLDAAGIEACRRLPRRQARALLDWTHRLRATTRALVDPVGNPPSARAQVLAGLLAQVPVTLTVPADDRAGAAPVTASRPGDRLRLALALAVVETLRLDQARIRRCEGERCVLLYYDTSRNRSRRWCDMAACGNRAKAAAHYRRTRHQRS